MAPILNLFTRCQSSLSIAYPETFSSFVSGEKKIGNSRGFISRNIREMTSHHSRRLLPREGLTIEALYYPFRDTALNPLFTGPLLFLLLKYPEQAAQLYAQLPSSLTRVLTPLLPSLRTLKGLLVWGSLRVWNNWFSRRSLNNWTSDTFDLMKEIVAISGGSGGIGKALVEQLTELGVKVIVLDLNSPTEALPPNAYFYQLDVTNSAQINEVALQIRAEHGEPTVLINNAGLTCHSPIIDFDEKAIQNQLHVNLFSHFLMTKQFLPSMLAKNHGHVVTVASMGAYISSPLALGYCSTKSALVGFHEGLSAEITHLYGTPRVRTTLVTPAYVRTPMTAHLKDRPSYKAFLEPATVADAIVDGLLRAEGGQIVLPGHWAPGSLLKGLPGWVGHVFQSVVARTVLPPDLRKRMAERLKSKAA